MTCEETGKLCFSNPHEARKFAAARMRGARIRVYRCETGQHFHVTRSRVGEGDTQWQ